MRDYLDQTDQAQRLLERAFDKNPRQDWLAVRLARRYQDSEESDKRLSVLQRCLELNPNSKIVHLELGRLHADDENHHQAMEHFRRSFTKSDNNYEAQFWYARELFLQGEFAQAISQFNYIHANAPGRFRQRTNAVVKTSSEARRYAGRLERKEEGYAFLAVEQMAQYRVFAARAESDIEVWETLNLGDRVTFELGFTRRGPRACSVIRLA